MSDLETLLVRLEADTERLRREMRRAEKVVDDSTDKMDKSLGVLDRSTANLGKTFGAFERRVAGLVAAGAIVAFGRNAVTTADQLGKTSEKLGISVEMLQRYRFAAEKANVAQATFDMGLQRFTRRVSEAANGTGEALGALSELDVPLRKLSDGSLRSTEEVFEDVADALAALPEQSDRVRLAFKLFDSEGVALVTLMQKGSGEINRLGDQLQALGGVMSEEAVADAERLRDAWQDLSVAITPVKTALIRTMADILDGSVFRDFIENNPFAILINMSERWWTSYQSLTARAATAIGILDAAVVGSSETMTRSFAEVEAGYREMVAQIVAREPEQERFTIASQGAIDALQAELDALRRTDTEQKIYNALKQAGVEANSAAGQKIAELARSIEAERRAAEAAETAQKRLEDARKKAADAMRGRERFLADLATENDMLRLQLAGQEDLIPLLEKEAELREIMGRALLPEEVQQVRELVAAQHDLNEALDDQEEARRQAENTAKEWQRIWQNAAENVQHFIADTIFDGTGDALERLNSVVKRVGAEVASAIIQPVIAPVFQGAQSVLGFGGGGGLSVPGIGGGQVGGGSGFDLGSLSQIGSGLFDTGNLLFNAGGAGAFREFATGSIGQALGLSQALPRGGAIGLTGFGGQASQAFGRLSSLGGVAGGFAGNFLADSLLGDRGVGASIGGSIGAIAGSFIPIPVVGTAIGAFAGNAIGGLFGNQSISEGQTLETSINSAGGIAAVGVDNGGNRQAAQQLADSFSAAISALTGATGGTISGGAYISQSAQSGLRLNQGGEWIHFSGENELLDYLIDNRLTGGDPVLVNAARRSSAGTIDGVLADVNTAVQIQKMLAAANENLSPLEQAIRGVNEQFSGLISKASELGLNVAGVVDLRDKEIAALRAQQQIDARASVLSSVGSASTAIGGFLTAQSLSASSSLNPMERLQLAQGEFERLLGAVRGGDLEQAGQLTQAGANLLDIGRQLFASSPDSVALERMVRSNLISVNQNITSEAYIEDQTQALIASVEVQTSQLEVQQEMVKRLEAIEHHLRAQAVAQAA